MWAFCLFVGSTLGRRTMGISTLEVGLCGTEMLAFAHLLSPVHVTTSWALWKPLPRVLRSE